MAGLSFAVAAISISIMVVGLMVGMRLIRGNRELVLFLRRFGYDDATSVVTFAAARTIGKSWRLVTLDDAAVAPVGVSAGPKRLLRAGTRLPQIVMTVLGMGVEGMRRVGPYVFATVVVSGAAVIFKDDPGSGEQIDAIYEAVTHGHPPFDAIGLSLPGVFAASMIVVTFGLLAFAAFMAVVLLLVAMGGLLKILSLADDAAQAADLTKHGEIENAQQIDTVAKALTRQSRRILAPRLVVLRVASAVWQPTVKRLATAGTLTIVDVSESSENLLWEIGGCAIASESGVCSSVSAIA